jgi:hypothetical protein
MDDALNIAIDYLIRTGQAVKFREAQVEAAQAIAIAWRSGVRNRLRLGPPLRRQAVTAEARVGTSHHHDRQRSHGMRLT